MAVKPCVPGQICVFLVDDHPLLRKGIADCINAEPDLCVCGEAGNAAEACAGILRLRPDVAVVDISMPGRDGIELLKDLRAQNSATRLLVFSMHDESLYALRALRAGASGYVMKSDTEDHLLNSIRAVHAGEVAVSPRLDSELLRQAVGQTPSRKADPTEQLSDRELQIMRLMGDGCQRKEIAAELGLSVKTIESHRARMCHKLRLLGRDALYRYAATLKARESAGGPVTAGKARRRARTTESGSAKNT